MGRRPINTALSPATAQHAQVPRFLILPRLAPVVARPLLARTGAELAHSAQWFLRCPSRQSSAATPSCGSGYACQRERWAGSRARVRRKIRQAGDGPAASGHDRRASIPDLAAVICRLPLTAATSRASCAGLAARVAQTATERYVLDPGRRFRCHDLGLLLLLLNPSPKPRSLPEPTAALQRRRAVSWNLPARCFPPCGSEVAVHDPPVRGP